MAHRSDGPALSLGCLDVGTEQCAVVDVDLKCGESVFLQIPGRYVPAHKTDEAAGGGARRLPSRTAPFFFTSRRREGAAPATTPSTPARASRRIGREVIVRRRRKKKDAPHLRRGAPTANAGGYRRVQGVGNRVPHRASDRPFLFFKVSRRTPTANAEDPAPI